MLIVVLVLLWIAVLSPIIVRRFRDQDTDRSIVNFHERMAHLGKGTPLVQPAHRLAVNDQAPPREVQDFESAPPLRAPRLRVVPQDATPAQLERDQSWDEWSRAYSDDPFETASPVHHAVVANNPRAAAYSRVPAATVTAAAPPSSFGSRSQRVRRRRVLLSLVASTVLSTFAVLFTNALIIETWALGSWLALVGFLGLMYYAMSVGMISSGVRPERMVNPRVATTPTSTIRYNEFDTDDAQSAEPWAIASSDDRYAQAL